MVGRRYQKQMAACDTQLQSYLGKHEVSGETSGPCRQVVVNMPTPDLKWAYARRPGQKALSHIGQNQIFAFVHG
jgi:hypothetical protein